MLLQLHEKDIDSPSIVKYAILESNGKLSVFKKDENIAIFPFPIIKNGVLDEDVLNILSDLRNSKESMTNIGLKYNIHRNTISKINKGEAYIIKNYDYPAR